MLFLRRPPYLRWVGMTLLVAFAAWVDLRGGETDKLPFAASDLAAGTPISGEVVQWKPAPHGLLPVPTLDGMVVVHPISEGEPILPSALSEHRPVPAGWWSIELPLPEGTSAGTEARVVVDDPPLATHAIVVSVSESGAFDNSVMGLVAIPAEYADSLARAAALGRAIVLVAP